MFTYHILNIFYQSYLYWLSLVLHKKKKKLNKNKNKNLSNTKIIRCGYIYIFIQNNG